MSDWRSRAACRGTDTEIFYAHDEARNATQRRRLARPAMNLCATCPVTRECLDATLAEPGPQHGIRGGTYPKQRTRMLLEGAA